MESNQDIRCLRCGGTIAERMNIARFVAWISKVRMLVRGCQATQRQIQRLSNFRLLENTLTRRLQSVIRRSAEDARREYFLLTESCN